MSDDQAQRRLHGDLRIVGRDKFIRPLHDPLLRIDEVADDALGAEAGRDAAGAGCHRWQQGEGQGQQAQGDELPADQQEENWLKERRQHRGHHPRMIRRMPPLLPLIMALDRTQIQLVDSVADNLCQMIFRKPLPKARSAGRSPEVRNGDSETAAAIRLATKSRRWNLTRHSVLSVTRQGSIASDSGG